MLTFSFYVEYSNNDITTPISLDVVSTTAAIFVACHLLKKSRESNRKRNGVVNFSSVVDGKHKLYQVYKEGEIIHINLSDTQYECLDEQTFNNFAKIGREYLTDNFCL